MSIKTQFFIIRADPCPQCQGTGKTEHKLLPLLRKWPGDPLEFCYQYKVLPETIQQPIRCSGCQGSGEVRTETTLEKALVKLGLLPTAEKEPVGEPGV